VKQPNSGVAISGEQLGAPVFSLTADDAGAAALSRNLLEHAQLYSDLARLNAELMQENSERKKAEEALALQ